MKYFRQWDSEDCGPACLAMIASYFNIPSNVTEIRQFSDTDKYGTNIKGLLKGAKRIGLKSYPVKLISKFDITEKKIKYPFIALVKGNNVEQFCHFIVVTKIKKNTVEIWDPNPEKGIYNIDKSDFNSIWSEYAIFFEQIEFHRNKKRRNIILDFFSILLPHKKMIIYSIFASLIMLFLGIIVSLYYKILFDDVSFSNSLNTLNSLSLIVMFILVLQMILGALRDRLINLIAMKTEIHLETSFISKILYLPIKFFDNRKTGDVISRLSDIEKIREVLSRTFIMTIIDVIMIIFITPLLLYVNMKLFIVLLVSVSIMGCIVVFFARIFNKLYVKLWQQETDAKSFLLEILSNIVIVKSINCEDFLYNVYNHKKAMSLWTKEKIQKYSIIQGFINSLIQNISNITIFWIGFTLIINNDFSLGSLISFNSLTVFFIGPLFRIINLQSSLQESLLASKRVGEILDLKNEANGKYEDSNIEESLNDIRVINLSFRYGSRKLIFNNLNISITKGSWIAFVGPSGSGKSTLVKLLLKMYKPEDGKILFGDTDISQLSTTYLRNRIGYVPQEITLFSGSISDNITMFNTSIKDYEIKDAAKNAGVSSFIENLPNGYKTQLGEKGNGLSGGEKQRIALARALVRNPELLILDEPTSNLDIISEKYIFEIIKKLKEKNMTIITIAHRLVSITKCDKIFVMKDGEIVEEGNHQLLLTKKGLYSEMWKDSSYGFN